MLDELRDRIIDFFTSRLTIFTIVFLILGAILTYRCFDLQIVHGEEYLRDFVLQIEKTKDLPGTRGNIYDRNGELLAYNELSYSVKIEDVFESGSTKNEKMNETIMKLIDMIEAKGDHVITDFKIIVNEDGEFEYTVEGNTRLRFIADILGKVRITDLSDDEKKMTAEALMYKLSDKKGFAIGDYAEPGNKKSEFICGKGYNEEQWLKLATIRYAMKLTSYRKYLGTIVATNVKETTVACIMENSDKLPGVTIVEDTIRKYVDSKYFAHVLGYTGKISTEELESLNEQMSQEGYGEDVYSINDVVGKSGIESSMETTLRGGKGYEKVIVDVTGKVLSVIDRENPGSGQNVYLTIDKELTEAVYNILEQKLAGLVSSKIINAKEYVAGANSGSADIKIPIYDVYYSMFNNSVIDFKHLGSDDAAETESAVYNAYLSYKEQTYDKIRQELKSKKTPYNKLSKEFQVYESNIVSLLNKNGVIITELVDANDATQVDWAVNEVISLSEYLKYCISKNWIDVSKLELNEKYSDSSETFDKLVDHIIAMLDKNTEFQKKFFKYMLLSDVINGKQVCMILCEQGKVAIDEDDITALYNGKMNAYYFMKNQIDTLIITPAMLALDPCNASVVITDVNTGDVLALVSYPGYDTNKMANSIDPEFYAQLITDKANPQYNFATQYKAAPGSTFKVVSATAGLMEGVISLKSSINCVGTFTAIQPSPRCWKRTGHGAESVSTAIRDSCNYFFYDIGYKFSTQSGTYNAQDGLDVLYQYADMFGLTDKSGVEISEATPEVSDNDPVRSAIGQGTHSFTTAALSRYAATIANNGTCYDLTLLEKITDSEGNVLKVYDPEIRNVVELPNEYWDAIHTGMRAVVQNKKYFSDLAVNVAGKTGTAEQTKSRPNHALFVCYAPYEQPEISVATRIPFGYSSDYAAQATRDIIKYYYGLAEDLIDGKADHPDGGVTNEM
ncbi:MAG: penicillin-binding protein [Acetatifactor sp.]|nr:penicillin-binding protein [Acetatifactor sp.]